MLPEPEDTSLEVRFILEQGPGIIWPQGAPPHAPVHTKWKYVPFSTGDKQISRGDLLNVTASVQGLTNTKPITFAPQQAGIVTGMWVDVENKLVKLNGIQTDPQSVE